MYYMALYIPLDWSFVSIQFFVLNVDGWFDVFSKNLLYFDIPLLRYHVNLSSSIMYCLYVGDIYLSFGISISFSSVFASFFACNSFDDVFLNNLLSYKLF